MIGALMASNYLGCLSQALFMKVGYLAFLIFLVGCDYSHERDPNLTPSDQDLDLTLRWVPSHAEETRQEVETGLLWAFSYLGADLPKGSVKSAFVWTDDTRIEVILNRLGFEASALDALELIVTRIKENQEYTAFNGLDIGRFLALTINSSNHYFAITGIARSLALFRSRFEFDPRGWSWPVHPSPRVIE